MIELIAVFFMAANISSAVACSEFWMISSVIGSFVLSAMPASLERDLDVAETVDLDAVARMHDHRRAGILHDGRTGEVHAPLELRAIIDGSLVDTFECVVHPAPSLQRRGDVFSGRLALPHGELSHLGGGDEVNTHHIHGRIEPVC